MNDEMTSDVKPSDVSTQLEPMDSDLGPAAERTLGSGGRNGEASYPKP